MVLEVDRSGSWCIYCGADGRTSIRKAHVYPQCILKNDLVLPLGVECDTCNEFHGRLERELLNHNRIGSPAMILGIPGKRGRPRRRHGIIERDVVGKISMSGVAKVVSATEEKIEVAYPDIAPLDDGRFRRALCHIALNYMADDVGADVAQHPRFDAVRGYVRYGRGGPWPYVQFMYQDQPIRGALGCLRLRAEVNEIVQVRTYVDDFYVDLESRTGEFLATWAGRTLPRGWALHPATSA